ncbi:hypothetical protein ACWEFJ_28410 [Actinosynnema sp. NPDC004786]
MSSTILPVHPTLLDPRTGEPLEAIGVINGRVIWPQMGGAPDDDEDQDDDQDDDGDEDQEPDDADDDQDDDQDDKPRGKRALRKKNSENRNLRRRLTQAEEDAQKWRDYQASQKTDQEKQADRLTEAETRLGKVENENVRLRIALSKGLTLKQAMRLVGDTEEELEADADDFLAELGEKPGRTDKTDKVKTRPRTALKGGARPDEEPDETDPRKLAAKVTRRGGRGF